MAEEASVTSLTAVETGITLSADENIDEEEIILEAECHKYNVCCQITLIFVRLMALALASVIFFPLFIIICCATVKKWRLYLTKRGVYHIRPGSWGCCVDDWFIPIEDIQDIHVRTWAKNTLVIKVGPEKLKEYINWCYRPVFYVADSLIVNHVKNAEEFAETVKREKTNTRQ